MTTPVAALPPAAGVCRLTVEGPAGSADLTLPASTPLSALLPAVLQHVTADADLRAGAAWVLQRLGEDPLDLEGSPETLGLRHGDLLLLRSADETLPALRFDDVADGVAHAVADEADRWRPELTRRLAVVAALLAAAAAGVTIYGFGPGVGAALACGAVTVLLTVSCAVLSRRYAAASVVRSAGLIALVFGGLTGIAPYDDAHGHFALRTRSLVTAAGIVFVLAVGLLALRALPFVLPGAFALLALSGAVDALLVRSTGLTEGHAVAVVAVGLYVAGHFGPRLALRAARLRVPPLPRTADELQQNIEPLGENEVRRRVRGARAYLNTLSMASAVVYAVAFTAMVRESGWIGGFLPAVFGAAVLLRARGLGGFLQRMPMALVGGYGLASVLITFLPPHGADARSVAVGVLLAAVVALLGAGWRLPTGRLLPVWGRAGDILETLAGVALLPLLLQALHVYAYFRSLTS